jgi:hypothetical protein
VIKTSLCEGKMMCAAHFVAVRTTAAECAAIHIGDQTLVVLRGTTRLKKSITVARDTRVWVDGDFTGTIELLGYELTKEMAAEYERESAS